jgi:16S rRNA (guanine527-N7)-methyltransferase
MTDELTRLCQLHNVPFTDRVIESVRAHFDLLLKWNQKISLSSITSPLEAARQHYFEPMFAARFINSDISTAADIGSGGGFPGIPVALLRPELSVTLIESDKRKAAFLGEARRILGLSNLSVVNDRFENLYTNYELVYPNYELVMVRAIERFEAQFSRLLEFSSASRQTIFFLSERLAKRVLENNPLPTWQSKIVLLPESRDRSLLIQNKSE